MLALFSKWSQCFQVRCTILIVQSPKFSHTFPTSFPAQLQITLANPIRSIWPALRPCIEERIGANLLVPANCVLGRHVDRHVLVSLCRLATCCIQQGKPHEWQAQRLADVPLVPGGKCWPLDAVNRICISMHIYIYLCISGVGWCLCVFVVLGRFGFFWILLEF